jgi:hypothetical protein
MPYVYVYECGSCGGDLEITLCREFEERPDGVRTDFLYPDPSLYEWPPRKPSGLWSHLWCDGCRGLKPLVLLQADGDVEHPVQLFLAAQARGLTGAENGPCPDCRAPLAVDPEGVLCPACSTGRLRRVGEYEP